MSPFILYVKEREGDKKRIERQMFSRGDMGAPMGGGGGMGGGGQMGGMGGGMGMGDGMGGGMYAHKSLKCLFLQCQHILILLVNSSVK